MTYKLGDFQRAVFYCGRANQITQSSNACFTMQTGALVQMGRLREAEIPAREAIDRWPNEPEQHLVLGRILALEGKTADSRKEFQRELQIDPNSSAARTDLAHLAP